MNRLIDLHCDWLLQYAPETTVFDPALYPDVSGQLGQTEGYLQSTSAAIFSCYRRATDWATQNDPWSALGALITRLEAEFPGRLLIGPEDLKRWNEDSDGLTWGLIGVEGFDPLIRSETDLDRLAGLLDRGVRLFQPVYDETSLLGGSAASGDDRGLLDLGRRFLEKLAELSRSRGGPRPIIDLAHLNPRTMADVLTWFEADSVRVEELIPVYSHGTLAHEGFDLPRAITHDNLARLRALGGWVGVSISPPFFTRTDQIARVIESIAAIPYRGQAGHEGIAVGTDFMGVKSVFPGLGNAPEVIVWLRKSFPRPVASALMNESGAALIVRAIGAR
jgi:membrane dipeptidase